MLGFLPWEKFPPLVLGPIIFFIGLLNVIDGPPPGKGWDDLIVGFIAILGGIAIVIYGIVDYVRKKSEETTKL